MKLELSDYHRNTPDNELIADLKNVAALLKQNTVTIDEYNQYGTFHATTLTRRFGSWFKCLEIAGLNPSRSMINISNEELFEELLRVWTILGKQPSYSEMMEISKFSASTYEKRFNGWTNALKAFISYVNEGEPFPETNIQHSSVKVRRTTRSINLAIRWKVLERDNFACRACGASPAKDSSVKLQVDHIIPWSKGGETSIDNLQTLCSKCNLGKSDKM